MRIKTFNGRTLEEILPSIRQELGDDAVVLSTRQVVTGGVGGFFGKRGVAVTAADRMPSDDELVDLEAGFGEDEGPAYTDQPVQRDVVGSLNASAGRSGGSVIDVTDEGSIDIAALVGSAVAERGAAAPAASAVMRQATDAYGRTAQAAPQASGFEQATLPERTPTLLDKSQLADAMLRGSAGSDDLSAPVPSDVAARAQQALTDATDEIRNQFGQTTSFAAEVRDPVMPTHAPERSAAPQLGASVGGQHYAAEPAAAPTQLHRPSRAAVQGPSHNLLAELAEAARALQHYLCVTGVNADVAQAIVGTVIEHRRPFSPDGDLRTLARDVIAETVHCSTGWKHAGRSHRVAFVGPSGSGKSTTVAKLAEGYMRGSGYRVGVISIVPELGTGMAAQGIGADPLIRRPNLDVRFVSAPEQMSAALHNMEDCDLVLIDTPSSAYLDRHSMSVSAACLSVAHVDETHVVIPLATSVREAESVIRHFQPMHVNRLVVTKLDESRYAGQLLNFGFRFGLPITYLSDGPQIPEDVRAASAREIAELIVPPQSRSQVS